MENDALYTSLAGGSVIFAFIGLYFVSRIWIKWKKMDMDVIKARVFLNKSFLERNWAYVFLSGAFLTSHQLIKFLISSNYIPDNRFSQSSFTLEFLALAFLVILAYEWYKVLHIKNNSF